MKMKVLSPAGNMESVKMAVFNGADEIYLGVRDFNARNNIEGLSLEEVKQAVDFAHIFNVRVFLTVNILFNDEELQSALNLIVDAYNLGVDAIIMQDIGLISLVAKHFPEIEIHASTQLAVHNLEGVRELEKLNVKRVVLSRETPLSEIKRIRENSNIEIEYFVHGALCVAFSGNCYLSSYLFDASGNRGKCKQLCRLPYELKFANKTLAKGYLLSAKDNNMLNRLEDLRLAGVNSLKIEGRARRPYYVGEITRAYRRAVDGLDVDEEKVKLAFNRGFTEGYFNGNSDIISNTQNHMGLEVGKVFNFKKGKRFNQIFFTTKKQISLKSTLKFVNGEEEIVLSAYDLKEIKNGYVLSTTQQVSKNAIVYLISDAKTEEDMLKTINKRNINIKVKAFAGEKIKAVCEVDNKIIELSGDVCEASKNRPLSKEELEINFNKNDYFNVAVEFETDGVFVVKQQLNQFRRDFFDYLIKSLTDTGRKSLKYIEIEHKSKCSLIDVDLVEKPISGEKEITVYSPCRYDVKDVENFKQECLNAKTKPVLNLPNFALKEDVEILKHIVDKTQIAVMVNNLYALNFEAEKFAGGGLNIYNTHSANYFGLPYVVAEGENIMSMPYMTLRHCPIKQHIGGDCTNCRYKNGYEYKMSNGKYLKLKRVKISSCTFMLTE